MNEYFETGYVKVHVMLGHSAKFPCGRQPESNAALGCRRVSEEFLEKGIIGNFICLPDGHQATYR